MFLNSYIGKDRDDEESEDGEGRNGTSESHFELKKTMQFVVLFAITLYSSCSNPGYFFANWLPARGKKILPLFIKKMLLPPSSPSYHTMNNE